MTLLAAVPLNRIARVMSRLTRINSPHRTRRPAYSGCSGAKFVSPWTQRRQNKFKMINIYHYFLAELVGRMLCVNRNDLVVLMLHSETELKYARVNMVWREYFYHFPMRLHES